MLDIRYSGANANKGAVVEAGKLKLQVEPNQTIEQLKLLIATAITGVELPFELQKHDEKKSSVYDNDATLSDCGLVSGSVVSIPLLEIHFVLPQGPFDHCLEYITPIIKYTCRDTFDHNDAMLLTCAFLMYCFRRRCSCTQGRCH